MMLTFGIICTSMGLFGLGYYVCDRTRYKRENHLSALLKDERECRRAAQHELSVAKRELTDMRVETVMLNQQFKWVSGEYHEKS